MLIFEPVKIIQEQAWRGRALILLDAYILVRVFSWFNAGVCYSSHSSGRKSVRGFRYHLASTFLSSDGAYMYLTY